MSGALRTTSEANLWKPGRSGMLGSASRPSRRAKAADAFIVSRCVRSIRIDDTSAFSLASSEKLHLQKVLNYTNGNKAEAARLLEIGIATLYRKIDEYKL